MNPTTTPTLPANLPPLPPAPKGMRWEYIERPKEEVELNGLHAFHHKGDDYWICTDEGTMGGNDGAQITVLRAVPLTKKPTATTKPSGPWLGLSRNDRKLIEATIMALDHACDGDFSDYCEDSEFGNELCEWLHAQKKRITTRPNQ